MLTVRGDSKVAPTGNFYFSPLGLRPVYEQAYLDGEEKLRLKKSLTNFKSQKKQRRNANDNDENEDDDEEKENSNDKTKITTTTKTKSKKIKKSRTTKKPDNKKKVIKPKEEDDDEDDIPELDLSVLEHLCTKLQLTFVLSLLGAVVIFVCCCTLYLRNRIISCFKSCCWPFANKKKKKKQNKTLFDVEQDGDESPKKSSIFQKSVKKKQSVSKMIDTGTQDSRTSVTKVQDDKQQSKKSNCCSSCCQKNSKKKKQKT